MTHNRGNKIAHPWQVGLAQVLIAMWWPRPAKQLVRKTKNNVLIIILIIIALIIIIVFWLMYAGFVPVTVTLRKNALHSLMLFR